MERQAALSFYLSFVEREAGPHARLKRGGHFLTGFLAPAKQPARRPPRQARPTARFSRAAKKKPYRNSWPGPARGSATDWPAPARLFWASPMPQPMAGGIGPDSFGARHFELGPGLFQIMKFPNPLNNMARPAAHSAACSAHFQ